MERKGEKRGDREEKGAREERRAGGWPLFPEINWQLSCPRGSRAVGGFELLRTMCFIICNNKRRPGGRGAGRGGGGAAPRCGPGQRPGVGAEPGQAASWGAGAGRGGPQLVPSEPFTVNRSSSDKIQCSLSWTRSHTKQERTVQRKEMGS